MVLLIMVGTFEMQKRDYACPQTFNILLPKYIKWDNTFILKRGKKIVFIIRANIVFYLKGYSGRFLDEHEI